MKTTALRLVAVLTVLVASAQCYADAVITNCTQQALIEALRDVGPDGGRITFDHDCSITVTSTVSITVPNTTLDASNHNVTISGGNQVRILSVMADNIRFVGLTFSGGKTTNSSGGALFVNTNITVYANDCVFTGNSSLGPAGTAGAAGSSGSNGGNGQNGGSGGNGRGGAIWNRGTLGLTRCTFSTNSATGGNGGAGGAGGTATGSLGQAGSGGDGGAGGSAYGGAIYNDGTVNLVDCTVAGNSASAGNGGAGGAAGTGAFVGYKGQGGSGKPAYGGGIYNAGTVTITSSAVSGNSVQGGNSAAGGTDSSGFGRNGPDGADAVGGGLCTTSSGRLVNSTFYGNTARGGAGGNGGDGAGSLPTAGDGGNGGNAIGGDVQNSGNSLSLLNCTLAAGGAYGGTNGVAGSGTGSTGNPGTPGAAHGGNIASTSGTCWLYNSLIIWEQFGACGYGTFNDGWYNLTSDTSITLGTNSFPNRTSPRAGTFGNHGGPTFTLDLLTNSPALNKIPVGYQPLPLEDQRGVPRPRPPGGASDIGAYEREATSPPIILTQPQDQTVRPGSNATFTVSAVGATPLSYQWFFGTNAITNATSTSYTVVSPQASTLGPYSVTVSNWAGTSNSIAVYVHLSPAISVQPSNQLVTAGANVSLTVAATGEQPLTYQWMLNGTNLVGATDASLQLNNVQVTNIGTYSVIVSNSAGQVVSSVATLNLLPTILAQPTSQSTMVGSPAVLTVSATGTPPLQYQWIQNGLAVSLATNSTLNYPAVQGTNAGVYAVTVYNGYGTTNSSAARLTVLVPLSGSVLEGTNNGAPGVPGVRLAIGTNSVVTASNGAYSTNLPAGSYPVIPSLSNYVFTPAGPTVQLLNSPTTLNFVATPLIGIALDSNRVARIFAGGVPGLPYLVDSSTNLSQWDVFASNIAPIQITFPVSTNSPGTFYRLRR